MAKHKDFHSLGEALKQHGIDIEEETTYVMKTAASEGLKAAVFNTAVDEGTARSNWIVSTNAPVEDTRIPFKKGSRLGIKETANAHAAINDGNARLRKYQMKDGSIFISNSVDYIGDLNRGTSPQSVGITIFALDAMSRVFRGASMFRRRQLRRLNK